MPAVWPLPSRKLHIGFQRVPLPNVVRSQFDVGPAKTRRRATARGFDIKGTITITDAELATFETWFEDTILDGSLEFDWTDPQTGDPITLAFVEPYSHVSIGPNGTTLQLHFESQP